MIISPRLRRKSALARLMDWVGITGRIDRESPVFSESQFRFEMEKERSRLGRRAASGSFGLILIDGILETDSLPKSKLILEYRW